MRSCRVTVPGVTCLIGINHATVSNTMQQTQTIAYDDKTAGRKVMAFPPVPPFASCLEELGGYAPEQHQLDALEEIAAERSIFDRATCLAELLLAAHAPHEDLLRIASLAAKNEAVGLRLMHAVLLALPQRQKMVSELAEFRSVGRLMDRIENKVQRGEPLKQIEDWFKKKVMLLSMSHPLPNADDTPSETPWTGWCEGVRLAIADPDPRWDEAILERAKVELEALDQRIKILVASLDPDRIESLAGYLFSLSEDTRWRLRALGEDKDKFGEASLVVQKKVGGRWSEIVEALAQSEAGRILVDLFEKQRMRTHSYPNIKVGGAVVRALMIHPILARGHREPDGMSCIHLYVSHAGGGLLEVLLRNSPGGKDLSSFLELPGLEMNDKLLTIDLKKIPAALFIDDDDIPRDIDWFEVQKEKGLSYKTLVLSYMDNDSFLAELLNNPKATGKPGIVALIALRCRSSRVLSIIANRRDLYTGFANKQVPYNLLVNPSRTSVSSLRKFIHVRYIDRVTLQRLSSRGSAAREEVRREVARYLNSLG